MCTAWGIKLMGAVSTRIVPVSPFVAASGILPGNFTWGHFIEQTMETVIPTIYFLIQRAHLHFDMKNIPLLFPRLAT